MINLCWPAQMLPAEKAVLMVFADAASDNGHCWLRVSSIEVKTCLSDRSVQRAVASLVARGYVRRELRLGRSSVFYLIPDAIAASVSLDRKDVCSPVTVSPLAPDAPPSPCHPPPSPCHPTPVMVSPPPDMVSPVTSTYPLLIPQTPGAQSACASDGYDEFRKAYPRNTAMAEARKAWHRLKPDADLRSVIMRAIDAQRQSEQWQRGVYPHAATWLRQRRWEDVMAVSAPGGFTSTPQQHACAECGARGTVMVDQRWYCREHNPNRRG